MADDYSDTHNLEKPWQIAGLLALVVILLIFPLSFYQYQGKKTLSPKEDAPTFVGREKCKDCHKPEYDKWQNSHHDKAMDVATPDTVLGDFNNTQFTHQGVTSRFFTKNGQFFVNTMGPGGENADFKISHTFGFYPLQQYLVPFPGGRLQSLTIAWDTVKEQWYALPNHTNDHTDWLHWTKAAQNWNGMCAECHSTNLNKGYDLETKTFTTTWSEIDVSCEACHGPASAHVAWAEQPDMARRETDNYNLVVNTGDIDTKDMINICARCHSRRASIEDFSHDHKDLMDYIIPSLLTPSLYFPDGQILDEVFVYGSFMQSKMFLRDVKCNDCHDVHSLALKDEGNRLCLSCHRADIYDTKAHHFHKKIYQGKESQGDDCIKCHMPERPYMGIDNRADHSLRIPRPDLSQNLGTPNSCSAAGCHDDKSIQWVNENMTKWYGMKKRPHYGSVINPGRTGQPDAHGQLMDLAKNQLLSPIVRATALSLLVSYPDEASFKTLEAALFDSNALVRQTAISTINQLQFDKDASLIFPLLYDPVKAVRIQAALGVASISNLNLSKKQKIVLNQGIDEYLDAMAYSADSPAGRFNLGLMYVALGQTEKAIENYNESIRIDSRFIPAQNNLAMLYNRMGQNEKAEVLLRQILKDQPDMFEMAYSLGLLLVEQKKYQDAVVYLEQAADGLPHMARIQYNLGLLLQFLKDYPGAENSLLKALSLEPENFQFLYATADHYIKTNNFPKAMAVAKEMQRLYPDNKTGFDIGNYIKGFLNKKK